MLSRRKERVRDRQTEFSSVQSLDQLSSGGHDRRVSRDSLPVFSAGGLCEQFWHKQGCHLFDVVHPAFPLPTTASPTLQGALKDGLGEAVVACDMPEPGKFPSLDSCQKRFLWTHKKVDLAPHPVIVHVLRVGDAEKFTQALDFKSLYLFSSVVFFPLLLQCHSSGFHVSQP